MNQIIPFVLLLLTLAIVRVDAAPLVNTEAGTFRCHGSIVRLDRHGVPSSGEPGGAIKPCDPIVPIEDTI